MFETLTYQLWINFIIYLDDLTKIISLLCIYFRSIINLVMSISISEKFLKERLVFREFFKTSFYSNGKRTNLI